MFTGLIETTGRIHRIEPVQEGVRLAVFSSLKDYQMGESIAVNGICLTVVDFTYDTFSAEASTETLNRTNLGHLRVGSRVHLERALRLGDRLGGHWVSGHIDGTGKIVRIMPHGASKAVTIEASKEILRYIVEKGSVALDGASLTVNRVDENSFDVMLIPHTQSVLSEEFAMVGRIINVEVDILGKYIEKLLACHNADQSDISQRPSPLTLESLRNAGFF